MTTRRYYHKRTGAEQRLSLHEVRRLVASTYDLLFGRGYFQEALGSACPMGFVAGTFGSDAGHWIHLEAWLENVYPFQEHFDSLDEPKLFAVIELLWDLVSAPLGDDAEDHTLFGCGWHYAKFDKGKGQREWREAVNRQLSFYGEGFELSADGEVQRLGQPGLADLMTAPIPKSASQENRDKMEDAVRRFRSGRSTRKDQQDAVEDLIKVLEFLRPQVKQEMLRKDEDRLFEIANEFALRHHNHRQKADYDSAWLTWMFCLYLATIHLVLHLIERGAKAST